MVYAFIYALWFRLNLFLTIFISNYISHPFGILYALISLELHVLCRAIWYSKIKYKNYQLNKWLKNGASNKHVKTPVLLIPGALGSCSYLGDLIVALENVQIPVFIIDIGLGSANESMRQLVHEKIQEIRTTIYNLTGQNVQVNVVGHSNGGNLAFSSAFDSKCSIINDQGSLTFIDEPKPNTLVDKIITIALPTDLKEVELLRQINKSDRIFNINARYDAVMMHKRSGLINDFENQTTEIEIGHVGIVYQTITHLKTIEFLQR